MSKSFKPGISTTTTTTSSSSDAENKLKLAVGRLLAGPPPLPPAPPAPLAMHPQLEFIYKTLSARQDVLNDQLREIYKVLWRSSAALLGLALPTLGPDAIVKILRTLGMV